MNLAIVVAMAENRVIGVNNDLPWKIPEDLQRFKSITMGHPLIMGRLTYDSIGRPLPGRKTIVVSRDKNWPAPEGVRLAHSCEEAVEIAKREAATLKVDTAMVVGGAKIYEQFLSLCNKLFVTEVHTSVTGDAFFPVINPAYWTELSRSKAQSNTADLLDYSFVEYYKSQ